MIDHRRSCRDQIEIVFPLKPFLDDIHMQQAQEAAAESEAESLRGLRFILQAGIVELKLVERIMKVLELGRIARIQAAVDHRIQFLVAGKRLVCRIVCGSDGIADPDIMDVLDRSRKPPDIPAYQRMDRYFFRVADAGFKHFIFGTGCHEADMIADMDLALPDADKRNDTAVAVIDAVEDKRLQRCFRISGRSRDLVHDLLEHLIDIETGAGADLRSF